MFLVSSGLTERLRQALLTKLSDYDYTSSFSDACDTRYDGTGQWLLDSSEFQEWDRADKSCGLWIHGIREWCPEPGRFLRKQMMSLTYQISAAAGSGKTIIAAGIIETLCSRSLSAGTSISYFFCTINDPKSRDPRTIISSLTRQILNIVDETPEIAAKLKSMFPSLAGRAPGIKELSPLLASVARLPATAYLLIDGLDECEDSDRRQVLSGIRNLIRDSKCRIKAIISSRWMDIVQFLDGFHQIALESSGACSDIELFVRGSIDEKIQDGSIVIKDPFLAEEIKQALIQKSDGMYVFYKSSIFCVLTILGSFGSGSKSTISATKTTTKQFGKYCNLCQRG